MGTREHPADKYATWSKLGPLKRDTHGRFARGNRGGPGRPPDLAAETIPFTLPSGRIHPLHLVADMALHDNQLRHDSPQNIEQLERAKDLWQTLLAETLCQGFTGEAWLHLTIDDGTIAKVRAHTRRTK